MAEEGRQRDETPKERADRELIELLNELRVVLPGVTVLLAFLLAVPFAKGWSRVTVFQRDVFVVAFLATAVSVALLTAPSSYHRLRFRHDGLPPFFLQHFGQRAHIEIGADARRVRRDELYAAGGERLRGGRERQQE